MPQALPERPSLEHLRKQAKRLLKAYRDGDRAVCDLLRGLPWLAGKSDDAILADGMQLGDIQYALGMAYGFRNWAELMSRADELAQEDPAAKRARRVQIDGVPDGSFDIHWDMPIRAAETLLRFRGIEADHDDILAVSGEAFSLCHASHWQDTAYLASPIAPIANAARAYGFEHESLGVGPSGPFKWNHSPEELTECTANVLARMRAEIDAGRPLIVAGAEAHCGSMTVVVGYEKNRDWFCHVGDGKPYRWVPLRGVAEGAVDEDFGIIDGRSRGKGVDNFVGGWQAYPVDLIGEKIADPTDGDRQTRAIALAVEQYRAPKASRRNWGGVDYFFGADAYEQWALALEDLDYPADLTKEHVGNGVEPPYDWYSMGNMDMQVDQIVTGRSAAERYCRRVGLDAAADAYAAEVAVTRKAFACFIPRFNGDDEPRRAFLSDPAACRAGADAIRRMLRHEHDAVVALQAG